MRSVMLLISNGARMRVLSPQNPVQSSSLAASIPHLPLGGTHPSFLEELYTWSEGLSHFKIMFSQSVNMVCDDLVMGWSGLVSFIQLFLYMPCNSVTLAIRHSMNTFSF